MRRFWLLTALLSSCSTAQSRDWKNMSPEQRQIALNTIADECKLSRSTFKFRPPDEMLFQPNANASFDSVDCALSKLKTLRGFGKMGFIGNEGYVEENKK